MRLPTTIALTLLGLAFVVVGAAAGAGGSAESIAFALVGSACFAAGLATGVGDRRTRIC